MSGILPLQLTEERWRRLDELFHAASDLSGSEREAFIARETAGDDDLRRELLAMLRHAGGAGDLIVRTVEKIAQRAVISNRWVGRHFGPYRIVREIGRGGMGLVFEARRDDAEYVKTVALKIAPDWRVIEGLRERFRNERQILARLEHPNIARFLDGGTDNGIPYFAMEYIEGKSLTAWVKDRQLGIRGRIELFRHICSAVHYAHENLVVHRDLKPANILVDHNDVPKLLDFGIATLVSPFVEHSGTTTGVRLLTPDYTSPEQIRGEPVTTRTDIYSLGLILYELLCGERAQMADSSSPLALDRSICEANPLLPSVQAAMRGDKALSRTLRGDLDTIVAMAIRKEPERRYGSAAALDLDLERYLEGRPVEARGDTPGYRLAKLIRRHWFVFTAGSVVAATLAGGVVSTLYEARRAERRFQQVRGLANAFVFDVYDRIENLPGSTEARKAIVGTALRYLESLRQDAGNDRALLLELASAYVKIGDVQGNPSGSNLGDSKGALESYRKAEDIYRRLAARSDFDARREFAYTLERSAELLNSMGDRKGLEELESARTLALQLLASRPNDTAILQLASNISSDIARLSVDGHNPERALAAAKEATDIAHRMVILDPKSASTRDYLAVAQNSLAAAYRVSGNFELSSRTYRDALAIRQQLVREHPQNTSYQRLLLVAWGHLGDSLGSPEANGLGDVQGSANAYQQAARIAEAISHADPANRKSRFDIVAAQMRRVASLLQESNHAAEATQLLRESDASLTELTRVDSANQQYRFYSFVLKCELGQAFGQLGKPFEAIKYYQQARSDAKAFASGSNEANARAWLFKATVALAQLRCDTGDRSSAKSLANEAAASAAKHRPFPYAWAEAIWYGRLGSVYLQLGDGDTAKTWLQKSADDWHTLKVPESLRERQRKELAAVEHQLEGI